MLVKKKLKKKLLKKEGQEAEGTAFNPVYNTMWVRNPLQKKGRQEAREKTISILVRNTQKRNPAKNPLKKKKEQEARDNPLKKRNTTKVTMKEWLVLQEVKKSNKRYQK